MRLRHSAVHLCLRLAVLAALGAGAAACGGSDAAEPPPPLTEDRDLIVDVLEFSVSLGGNTVNPGCIRLAVGQLDAATMRNIAEPLREIPRDELIDRAQSGDFDIDVDIDSCVGGLGAPDDFDTPDDE